MLERLDENSVSAALHYLIRVEILFRKYIVCDHVHGAPTKNCDKVDFGSLLLS